MGTNFYIKKTAENLEILKNEALLFIQKELNERNPRERQRYIEKFFDLVGTYMYYEIMMDRRAFPSSAFQYFNDIQKAHKEYMDKYQLEVTKLCCKYSLTLEDMNVVKELLNSKIDDEQFLHIGKRSAAGHYCKKCNMTYAYGGMTNLHGNGNELNECPVCGLKRELATRVCSFTWQWGKEYWEEVFEKHPNLIIVDEYNDEYTIDAFWEKEIYAYIPFNLHADEKRGLFS